MVNSKRRNNVLVSIAIFNVIVLTLVSYLTLVMYRVNLGSVVMMSKYVIVIFGLLSCIMKFRLDLKAVFIISIVLDFVLVIYIYNPVDSSSIGEFITELMSLYTVLMSPFYLYLIIYYIWFYKNSFVTDSTMIS